MSAADSRTPLVTASKIEAHHLERLAVVYVRQSTAQQVLHHQESTKLQYNLVERARTFGWPAERVLVIDDDLGRSGSSAEGRPGFQRLVAEVGLGHVGLILGVEMSRLARNNTDWHRLLEVCGLFHTLISDLEGVYDPAHFNDRLLLGLKGTMSEAELYTIKQRMHAGRMNKASRGELGMGVPMGYVRRPSGEVSKEPDEQARAVIELVFALFVERGTLDGVLCALVERGVQMPSRVRSGPDKGELRWVRPNRMTLNNLMANPIYAGAYVWGRRSTDPRAKIAGRPSTGRKVAPKNAWAICLHDRLPAYITWSQYEANQKQLASNRNVSRGVPRRGELLLARMIRCGRCGHRMVVQYSDGRPRYTCNAARSVYAGPRCQSLRGVSVDAFVSASLLRALEPAALEVSLAVAADVERTRSRDEALWQQRLERAQYDVDRLRRQYNAVEPENRLVARTLENALEQSLSAQRTLELEHRRHRASLPATLTERERGDIRRLALDLPTLWNAPTTTVEQRKEIARQLIDEVTVTVEGESERVAVSIAWLGGHQSAGHVVRPVARLEQLSYYPALLARIEVLRDEGKTFVVIATVLNNEGWRPPKRRATFNTQMVTEMIERTKRRAKGASTSRTATQRRKHEWPLRALAEHVGMPSVTLYTWIRRGWVTARKVPSSREQGEWLVRADAKQVKALRARRAKRASMKRGST